jgi:hypothetical protein
MAEQEKVLYISGAVTGTQDAEERFRKTEEEFTKAGYKVLNPQKMCATLPELEHGEYMKLCFVLLDMCNYFHQIPGWENSRGANQEYGYALATDKYFV